MTHLQKQSLFIFLPLLISSSVHAELQDDLPKVSVQQTRKKSNEVLEMAKFIGASEAAFLGYACLHNLVNIRVSEETFRDIAQGMYTCIPQNIDGHKNRMACQLGIHGTWWMGLLAALPIYATARLGDKPKMELADVAIPASVGIGVTAGASLLTGLISAALGENRKNIANYAQTMAYLAGALAIVGVCVNNWTERKEREKEERAKQTS